MVERNSIGYLTFSADRRNGMGRFSIEVIRRVAARGHRALVLTYHKDQVDEELAARPGVEVRPFLPSHYDLCGLWRNAQWARRVRRQLEGCDFIHSLFDFPHVELALRAARRLGVPYVATAVGTYSIAPLYDRRYAGRLGLALTEAHRVISISRYTLREVEKQVPIPRGVVVPLGIDAEAFVAGAPGGQPPPDRFQLVGVGALKSRKGWDLLIAAIARLRDLDPPVHATIVGGFEIDDAQARLRQQAADLGVADRVHFPGVVDDQALKGHYQSSHVYVMPSRSDRHKVEGFGLVYLEAGAFGRPQIGCLDTGAEEPIVDGETGFLVPQNDPEALAAAIARLHGDRLLLERMGEAARARAHTMTWDATVEGIMAQYPWRQVSRGFDSRIMRMRRW